MMSIEIKVNGSIVAIVHARNSGYLSTMDDVCRYEWTGSEFPIEVKGDPAGFSGNLKHSRADGILELSANILRAMADK